jgi:protoheme ferro-lyase
MIIGFCLGIGTGLAIVCLLTKPSWLYHNNVGLNVGWMFDLMPIGAVGWLIMHYNDGDILWKIIAMACGAVLGYVMATFKVMRPAAEPTLPSITRTDAAPGDHDAVVYFTHGEPERYDPEPWLHQFREFDEGKIPFIPWLFRPMFLYAIRKHYSHVGTSHHRKGHEKIIASLKARFEAYGDTKTRFYLSFLDDHPHPDAMAIQAANDGASRIIMLKVFVTTSNHTKEGETMVSKLGFEKLGMKVVQTTPLWDSDPLASMFVEKAVAVCPDVNERPTTGILLVGHGQPKSWDKEFPTETSQEAAFRERLRDRLVAVGFSAGNIRSAWMQFRVPEVVPEARALGISNIKRLLVFSAAISADSLHSQFDVPQLVRKAHLPSSIEVVHLGAWNDHPRLVDALEEKISATRKGISS